MELQIEIPFDDIKLAATLHKPLKQQRHNQSGYPLVIICHGFIGNRIGVDRLFVKASRDLAAHGYMVLRFDYAGCGESFGDYGNSKMDDLIRQTHHVIDHAIQYQEVDPGRVTLLGHSLGGAVATLAAVNHPKIKSLVLWAPVAHPFHDIVKIVGVEKYMSKQQQENVDYLGYSFTNNYFGSLKEQHPIENAHIFTGDVFIVHGSADEVIPVDYCHLYQQAFLSGQSTCEKEVILGANHTFSSVAHTEKLLELTRNWLIAKKELKVWGLLETV